MPGPDTLNVNNDVQVANHPHFEPTIQQETYYLHLDYHKAIRDKIEKEAAELRQRGEKIRFIHEIIQEINSHMDSDGNIDLSKYPQLKEKLKAAEELGISVTSKDSLNSHESRRLIDNLNFAADDWTREDNTQMRKMQNMYSDCERTLMMVKHAMTRSDTTIREMAKAIGG